MLTAFTPTKTLLLGCELDGANISRFVNSIQVYESLCKPYITAKIVVFDNNNVINTMNQAKGGLKGKPVYFAFTGGEEIYQQQQYVFEIKELPSQENLRYIVYEISTIGLAYYKDRANLVQTSPSNQPATAVAQQIHDQYLGGDAPLRVMMPSNGFLAQDTQGGFDIPNVHPFKAIRDVLDRATYSAFPSGTSVYFRDRDSYVMAPLEMLFATMGEQARFIQSATWGTHIDHIFDAHFAIISASTVTGNGEGGAGKGGNLAAAASQGHTIMDRKKHQIINEAQAGLQSLAPWANMALPAFGSKFGGKINVLAMDESRNPLQTDPALFKRAANLFQAAVKDAANYHIKVPIKGGLKCTVGKGIYAKLIPPVGDLGETTHPVSGRMLCADVVHTAFFDKRTVQGTTTIRAVLPGGTGVN